MPSADEVLIADSIVAELNGHVWSLPFEAAKSWNPWAEAIDLQALRVAVLPLTIPVATRLARSNLFRFDNGVLIDFQQKVPVSGGLPDAAAVDALCYLAQQVFDFYKDAHPIHGATNYRVLELLRPEVFDRDRLWEEHVFETWIELTVKGERA